MIIAVDFDGTCVTHAYPYIGEDIGATPVLRKLVANEHRLILWTMRSGEKLDEAVDWFEARKIELFGVNTNPEQTAWTASPKAYAEMYIDDAALGTPLIRPINSRPYVNWRQIRWMLEARKLI